MLSFLYFPVKPAKVKIVTPNNLLSSHGSHNFRCETSGSYPSAKLSWLLDGKPIRDAVVTVSFPMVLNGCVLNQSRVKSQLRKSVSRTEIYSPLVTCKIPLDIFSQRSRVLPTKNTQLYWYLWCQAAKSFRGCINISVIERPSLWQP